MSTSSTQKSEPVISSQRLGIAGVAAFVGCVACCAAPLLAAAGLGSGALGALSSVFRPGSELLVGSAVFVVTLSAMTAWSRLRSSGAAGCGAACRVDGACCDKGSAEARGG